MHPSFRPRKTDRPHRTHNGMDLSRSEGRESSRLMQIYKYLSENGPKNKRDIIRFGLNKSDVVARYETDPRYMKSSIGGWGTYVFSLAFKYGHLSKKRVGRTVLWAVNPTSSLNKGT